MASDEFLHKHVYSNTMVGKLQVKELSTYFNRMIRYNVDGDYVECGVWKGGLSCLILNEIIEQNLQKKLWLYDTFEGMTEPTRHDISHDGSVALNLYNDLKNETGTGSNWCFADLNLVRENLRIVYADFDSNTKLVKGPVEQTLYVENNLPEKICLMRLDTDWYESTKVELEVFWPRLSIHGIIILDDYSGWMGQRKAVDEFLEKLNKDNFQFTVGVGTSAIIQKF